MCESTPTPSTPQPQVERQAYAPPRLVVHGSASELTAGITVGTSDGKSGSGPA